MGFLKTRGNTTLQCTNCFKNLAKHLAQAGSSVKTVKDMGIPVIIMQHTGHCNIFVAPYLIGFGAVPGLHSSQWLISVCREVSHDVPGNFAGAL